jgi:hypothetical protein
MQSWQNNKVPKLSPYIASNFCTEIYGLCHKKIKSSIPFSGDNILERIR